jgi:hypothetical protein
MLLYPKKTKFITKSQDVYMQVLRDSNSVIFKYSL